MTSWPSGNSAIVTRIVTFDGDLAMAFAPMSVTLTLDDEIDISRGDVLTPFDSAQGAPSVSRGAKPANRQASRNPAHNAQSQSPGRGGTGPGESGAIEPDPSE